MNLTFLLFFPRYCPRVTKGRACARRGIVCVAPGATFTSSRQPPVGGVKADRACEREKMSRCRDPRCASLTADWTSNALCSAFIYNSCITYMRRAITFISIMTGEQLNLHGKSHRPRNKVRPRIHVDRFYRCICVRHMYVYICIYRILSCVIYINTVEKTRRGERSTSPRGEPSSRYTVLSFSLSLRAG